MQFANKDDEIAFEKALKEYRENKTKNIMAENDQNQNQNQPPKTTDIVNDNTQKEIKGLQTRLSDAEKKNDELKTELGTLQTIVKKLGELPPRGQPVAAPKPVKSLLQEIEEMIWPPKAE